MLQIRNMSICRGSNYRIRLPELALQPGEVVAITGASGCGKSTLLEMIGLILQPAGLDCYQLAGVDSHLDVAALLQRDDQPALADLRARQLGFVLQDGGLLPFLSVRQNIALPRRLLGLPPASDLLGEAIARLGLETLLERAPHQLSVGERQRVAFIRAIAHGPRLLLADEPTAALDPQQARTLFGLMLELARAWQISTLVVSHDWALVEQHGLRTLTGFSDDQAPMGGTVFDEQCR